jgi:dihydroorotate dehydrogenase
VGLAAGFDKNAIAVPGLEALGFGFVEVGAVSARPSTGNPKPRVFRLKADRAVINRMGLPNDGADAVAKRLAARPEVGIPVFANIVKTAGMEGTAAEMAADYVTCLEGVLQHVDGATINVSCPSAPELGAFGAAEALHPLLAVIGEARDRIVEGGDRRFRPLLLKVSPDISDDEQDAIVTACRSGLIDGLVLTNTTRDRSMGLSSDSSVTEEVGGLSGPPLLTKSLAKVAWFRERIPDGMPIIGVGGISNEKDARAMLAAGASLIEIYTGLIYEGPQLVQRLVRALR